MGAGSLLLRRSAGPASPPPPIGPYIANPNWFAFAADQSTGLLLLSGSDGAILRSTDHGATFERARTNVSEPLFGLSVQPGGRLAVAVGASGCVLVSNDQARSFQHRKTGVTQHLRCVVSSGQGILLAVGERGVALRSVDAGASFRVERIGSEVSLAHATALQSGEFVLAGEHGTVLREGPGGTWEPIALGLDTVATCLHALGKGAILLGTDAGVVFRSVDGRRFQAVGPREFFATGFAENRDGTVCLATTRGGQLWKSTDGGLSWGTVHPGLNEYLSAIAFSTSASCFTAVGNRGALLEADASAVHFERSTVRHAHDLEAVASPPGSRTRLVAGRGGFLARLLTKGSFETVFPAIPGYLHAVLCTSKNSRLVAVGSAGTCVASSDGGVHWSLLNAALPAATTLFGVCEHRSSGAWLIGGSGGTLLRSADGGRSFQELRVTDQTVAGFYVHGARLLALTLDEGVYYSDDGGKTFRSATLPHRASLIAVTGSVVKNRLFAVGMQGLVLLSTDGGQSWQQRESGTDAELRAVIEHPQRGEVWVVGTKGAVLCSRDRGATFQPVPSQTTENLLAVGLHAASSSILLTGVRGTLLHAVSAERVEPLSVDSRDKLRLVLNDPRTSELLVVGSGGKVLRGTAPSSLRSAFTHTSANLASAAYHPPSRSWIFVGERILRLPSEGS